MALDEKFVVDRGRRVLERHVVPSRGKPYVHRVSFEDFEMVSYAIGELADRKGRFTISDLASHEFGDDDSQTYPIGTTRVSTVLAFARECSLVEKVGRGHEACDLYDPLFMLTDLFGFNSREFRPTMDRVA